MNKPKIIEFLKNKNFTEDQIELVLRLLKQSNSKLIEDIIKGLNKKKLEYD